MFGTPSLWLIAPGFDLLAGAEDLFGGLETILRSEDGREFVVVV